MSRFWLISEYLQDRSIKIPWFQKKLLDKVMTNTGCPNKFWMQVSLIKTLLKVKFLSKNSIWIKLYNFLEKSKLSTIPNIFTSFSPRIFLTIFLVKSKLSTAKKYKTTTFSRVFHPKKSTISSGNQSWIIGQKMKISNSVNSN